MGQQVVTQYKDNHARAASHRLPWRGLHLFRPDCFGPLFLVGAEPLGAGAACWTMGGEEDGCALLRFPRRVNCFDLRALRDGLACAGRASQG